MRRRVAWVVATFVVAGVGAGGCAGKPIVSASSKGGTVAVLFTMRAPTTPGLALAGDSDLLGLEHLDLFGDVSSAPQAMLHDAILDPSSSMVQTVSFTNLPQGVYSQLDLDIEHVRIDGTFQNIPLHAHFDLENARVDLRASPPPELLPGDTVQLPVTVDADLWWRDIDLSQATLDGGEILIDLYHNEPMAEILSRALTRCFTLGQPRS